MNDLFHDEPSYLLFLNCFDSSLKYDAMYLSVEDYVTKITAASEILHLSTLDHLSQLPVRSAFSSTLGQFKAR